MIAEKQTPADIIKDKVVQEAAAFIKNPTGYDINIMINLLDNFEMDINVINLQFSHAKDRTERLYI